MKIKGIKKIESIIRIIIRIRRIIVIRIENKDDYLLK